MIVSAYYTLGKTTIANKSLLYLDLDSIAFKWVRKGNKNWIKTYCDLALYLEKQGYIVLVSVNPKIHKYLKQKANKYCIIIYDDKLRDDVVTKAEKRGTSQRTLNFIKNKFYVTNNKIKAIAKKNNISLITINDMNYDLESIINKELNAVIWK